MKEIQLTNGMAALVDDEDLERLNRFRWNAAKRQNKTRPVWYAVRYTYDGGKCRCHLMHRELVPGSVRVDHADGNGLNNQRGNLRDANASLNGANQVKQPGCTSRFKGVYWHSARNKWMAQIKVNGHRRGLGYFVVEEDAARAYDAAAKLAFGEFALLNLKYSLLTPSPA